ncbi:aminotransferase [Anaeramoeba flamelloides]|uniref:Aminotransferase n=1 Tax=Anaeramoeba flamelloides TaxID=1746091 RepID=A0ABQ8Z431_9EUKA|nr:aminotransferase [Anaeramoeba flamelloides]
MKSIMNLEGQKSSATLVLNQMMKTLEKQGRKVYKFGFGQSPFPVPKFLVNELKKNAFQKSYEDTLGVQELRSAIADWYKQKYNVDVDKEQVMITTGSKAIIFHSQMINRERNNVMTPAWVSYLNQNFLVSQPHRKFMTTFENKWQLNTQDMKSMNKNDHIIINSPNNPTGLITDMKKFAQDINPNTLVFSDEIYSLLSHLNPTPPTMLNFRKRTIVSNGLSKWAGAGGWRFGFAVFSKDLLKIRRQMGVFMSELSSCTPSPVQHAAIKLFREFHLMDDYLKKSNFSLHVLTEEINKILHKSQIKFHEPEGGFYYYLNFNNYKDKLARKGIYNNVDFCTQLLKDTGVAVLAGSYFGHDDHDIFARYSYVDFNGSDVINNDNLSYTDIVKIGKKVLEGTQVLVDYLENL